MVLQLVALSRQNGFTQRKQSHCLQIKMLHFIHRDFIDILEFSLTNQFESLAL